VLFRTVQMSDQREKIEKIARIIDGDAWESLKDGRDQIVGSLWANRRLWATQKADAILALIEQPGDKS